MNFAVFNTKARSTAIWGLAGLGFALPLPTAWANLMLGLTLLGWLGSGHWQEKWQALKQSSSAKAVGLFILMVVAGMLYGEHGYELHYFSKYASLLLLPLILTLQLSPQEKWRLLTAFCAAMMLTLMLSMLIWLEWLPTTLFRNTEVGNPIVFKLHITHGFFMILAAFFMYIAATQKPPQGQRLVLLLLVLMALVNALLMIKGRTGQVALAVLLIYLFHLRFPRYGILAGLAATLVLALTAYAVSPAFKERADIAITEAQQWQDRRGDTTSSIGTRLDYYTTAAALIQDHPILGVGTGGFPQAYERKIEGTALQPSNNPHNQYLLVTAQYGLIGLVVILFLYASLWRQCQAQEEPWRRLATGILLAYLIGNLFNSFMLDFSERLLFAWAMGLLLSTSRPTDQAA